MLFHTTAFILGFLPVCLAGFFTLGRFCGAAWGLRWLIACSLFFYGWWNPGHLPLLIGSVVLNHFIARKLRHTDRIRAWMAAGVGLNLAALGWFKYADFLMHIVAPDAPALHVTLPLAISFFTFQQIMFLVDTGRDAARPRALSLVIPTQTLVIPTQTLVIPTQTLVIPTQTLVIPGLDPGIATKTGVGGRPRVKPGDDVGEGGHLNTNPPLLTYTAFVTFFPHLIAGPIVRPSEIIPQLAATDLTRPRMDNITDGLLIFLLGLGKKLVLADMFGGFADVGFNAVARGASLTFFEAWYATLSYALQVYFDFSGYSDMAIGLARMLNIRFPLNFDSPYQATNIADFWRRWHITLGGFLRDYLYIPLGGNRRGPLRQTGNLMATMLLCGLWHGAAWNFVIWGGLQGVLIVIHKQYQRKFPPLPRPFGQALTLLAVTVAWVPFRAVSIANTMAVLRGMAGGNGITLPRMIVSSLPGLTAIADPVTVLPYLGDARTLSFPEVSACLLLGWLIVLTLPNVQQMTDRARHWTLTGSFALSVQALLFAPHIAPFLYFQF